MNSNNLLITVLLIAMIAGSAAAQSRVPQEESKGRTDRKVKHLHRENFRALPKTQADSALERAIRRIEKAKLDKKKKTLAEEAKDEPIYPESETQPSSQPTSIEERKRKISEARKAQQAALAAADRAEKEQKKAVTLALKKLSELPADVITAPAALGDRLYRGGHIEAAQAFYKKALEKKLHDETQSWVLFQLANCARHRDDEVARGYYRRVINEHPDCPWASAANTQARIIDWRMSNKPKELLKSVAAKNNQDQ